MVLRIVLFCMYAHTHTYVVCALPPPGPVGVVLPQDLGIENIANANAAVMHFPNTP